MQGKEILDIAVIVTAILIILVVLINFISISIAHSILLCEIEEIHDEDLQVNLLHCLNDISKVFFKRFLYFKEIDFFSDRKEYNNLIRFRMNHTYKFTRHTTELYKVIKAEETAEV